MQEEQIHWQDDDFLVLFALQRAGFLAISVTVGFTALVNSERKSQTLFSVKLCCCLVVWVTAVLPSPPPSL